MNLNVITLGRCEYDKALKIQYDILGKRQNGDIEDTLILVEHPPVITMGRRAVPSNVIVSKEFLKDKGIQVIKTNRGGDVTYHGPGQIVGYTIVNLKENRLGIKEFVAKLEGIFIGLLKEQFDIKAKYDLTNTGVWVADKKITAIGLAVKRGVTMHGFALNVNTNLDHFQYIIPCGIQDKGVTSIQKIVGQSVNLNGMSKLVENYFLKTFDQ